MICLNVLGNNILWYNDYLVKFKFVVIFKYWGLMFLIFLMVLNIIGKKVVIKIIVIVGKLLILNYRIINGV